MCLYHERPDFTESGEGFCAMAAELYRFGDKLESVPVSYYGKWHPQYHPLPPETYELGREYAAEHRPTGWRAAQPPDKAGFHVFDTLEEARKWEAWNLDSVLYKCRWRNSLAIGHTSGARDDWARRVQFRTLIGPVA